jgi:hypothetical protein
VLTLSGELTEENAYRKAVDQCLKAGAFPTHPLPPGDVDQRYAVDR